jgi:lipoprotein-anchoring transpeptidase ErfK/SrfK
MRSRAFVILAAIVVVLLAATGGVYAYDRGGRDTIPKGVRVAGINVGGLDAAQARARLERDYLARLRTPIRVDHGTQTFTLGPNESHVAANLGAMVDQALAEARSGNMFSRTFRRLTGGKLHVDLTPQTTYSAAAAVRLVDHVRAGIDRAPQDASVGFDATGLQFQPSHQGLAVLARELHREIDRAIVDPSADHTLVAHTTHVAPKVSSAQLTKQYATALIVDRSGFKLRLFKDFKEVKAYTVAIGMQGLETPAGLYHIQDKQVDPSWIEPNSSWVPAADRGKVVPPGPNDPLKARWLGIINGAGIHGIDPSEYGTIGHQASHGCVRMTIPDVIDLYPRVPVGAPIYIV